MRRAAVVALCLVAASVALRGQPERPAAADVDRIFARWTSATPGCAVGVSVGGVPVLTRAYGMADLEHDVPNTPETIFEAGSVSKQFTAASVLLLARDGKLSLDDPIRKYIPELPDYGTPITIRQMLTHTSGLRDWGSVAAIAGWPRTTRVHTHAHVLDIVRRQSALNFPPGTRYSYSNTGYNLAAILVSRVSGMPFAEFSRERIFEPLGMTSTSWRDDHRRVVRRRAIAYRGRDGEFEILMPFEDVHGNGGLLTTVGDLLKWNRNFASPIVGDAAFVREQETPGRFTDGRAHGYALGLMVGTRHGLREIAHSGSTAGYRAHLTRFPDQQLSVAVLCNAAEADATEYANDVAALYLAGHIRPDPPRRARHVLTPAESAAATGMFRDTTTGEALMVTAADGGVRIARATFLAESARRFASDDGRVWQVDGDGRATLTDRFGTVDAFERVEPAEPGPDALQALAGTYWSEDAETEIVVAVENGSLVLKRRPDTTIVLRPLYKDAFAGSIGTVVFRRDGPSVQFSIVQDRVWDMRFTRRAGETTGSRPAARILSVAPAIGAAQAELRSGQSAGALQHAAIAHNARRELDAFAQRGVLRQRGPGAAHGASARSLERTRPEDGGAVDSRAHDDARGEHAARASRSTGQPASTPLRPDRAAVFVEIDRLVHDFMEREHVPGAAWGVIIDGKLVHRGTAGVRERATGAPVTPDTVFRIASMTKSFTAMAVLKLRDEGRLTLDDPVERHVPEFRGLRYPTGDSPAITVRHLLTHSAGFPEDNPWGDQQLSVTEDEFSEMLRRGIPFSTTPGVAYEYSNYGYAILGRIIANVAKMPYREYIARSVLRPLGLGATTLDPTSVPADRLAHGYRWEDGRWSEEPLLPDGAFGAMGGMLTSLDDLARYVAVYLDAWPPRDGPDHGPIARASLREMQQAWRARPAVVTRDPAGRPQLNAGGYGYGLRVTQTCEFEHVVAHTGGLPGFGSIMQWLPDYGAGFVAMGNRTYTGWSGVAAQALEILRRAGAIERRQPQPSDALRRARDEVSQLVIAWDDALADRIAAINLYRDRSKESRRQQIEALRAKVGACRPAERFTFVENALRGTWTLDCERGDIDVIVTLAPTMPPLVQYLEVAPSEPRVRSACR